MDNLLHIDDYSPFTKWLMGYARNFDVDLTELDLTHKVTAAQIKEAAEKVRASYPSQAPLLNNQQHESNT